MCRTGRLGHPACNEGERWHLELRSAPTVAEPGCCGLNTRASAPASGEMLMTRESCCLPLAEGNLVPPRSAAAIGSEQSAVSSAAAPRSPPLFSCLLPNPAVRGGPGSRPVALGGPCAGAVGWAGAREQTGPPFAPKAQG